MSDQQSEITTRVFGVTLNQNTQKNEYDLELISLALELESGYFSRGFKFSGKKIRLEELRVKQWTQRLCEENSVRCLHSDVLLRNRNLYLKLLWKCSMILGTLIGPFKKVPPQLGEELPLIQNFQITEIQMAVETHLRETKLKVQEKYKRELKSKQGEKMIVIRNRSQEDLKSLKKLQEQYETIEYKITQSHQKKLRKLSQERMIMKQESKQFDIYNEKYYSQQPLSKQDPLSNFLDDHYAQMLKVQQKKDAAAIKVSYLSTSSRDNGSLPIPMTKSSHQMIISSSNDDGDKENEGTKRANLLSYPSVLKTSSGCNKRPFSLVQIINDHAISVNDLQPALKDINSQNELSNMTPIDFDQFLAELRSVREETKKLLDKRHLFIKN